MNPSSGKATKYIHNIFYILLAVSILFTQTASAIELSQLNTRTELEPVYGSQSIQRVPWINEGHEATLSFSTTTTSAVGATTSLRVVVNPGSENINGTSVYLKYPTTTLALQTINEGESAFAFSFVEYIDMNEGIIALHYLQPFPGISEIATVFDVVFVPLAVGTSTLQFLPETQVLANDGYGTDVLEKASPVGIMVK